MNRLRAGMGGWLVPSLVLVLLPKCPICLAADVALLTGMGLSVRNAAHLRTALLIACITALGFVAVRTVRRWVAAKSSLPGSCD